MVSVIDDYHLAISLKPVGVDYLAAVYSLNRGSRLHPEVNARSESLGAVMFINFVRPEGLNHLSLYRWRKHSFRCKKCAAGRDIPA